MNSGKASSPWRAQHVSGSFSPRRMLLQILAHLLESRDLMPVTAPRWFAAIILRFHRLGA